MQIHVTHRHVVLAVSVVKLMELVYALVYKDTLEVLHCVDLNV